MMACVALKATAKSKGTRIMKIQPYKTPRIRTVNEYVVQKIADYFGDSWHKFVMDIFVVPRTAAPYGNGWHK